MTSRMLGSVKGERDGVGKQLAITTTIDERTEFLCLGCSMTRQSSDSPNRWKSAVRIDQP